MVVMVNEELQSASGMLQDQMDTRNAELKDVRARFTRLQDVLETGKMSLDDLSPRIKELGNRQNELIKAKTVAEAELIARGQGGIDEQLVKAHAWDIKNVLEEAHAMKIRLFYGLL